MRFWDPSALVPALIAEPASPTVRRSLAEDRSLVAWWGTSVECMAAIARAVREGRLGPNELADALRESTTWRAEWSEVGPTTPLRTLAERLLRTHPLRSGDALQLAAAITASEGSPLTLPFVTRDQRLAEAATLEGFPVIRLHLSV